MQRNKFSKKEFFIIVFAAAVLALLALMLYVFRERGAYAVVTVGEDEKLRAGLFSDREFEINGAVIEIKDGKVRVKSSDCPDKICVHTGFISKEGETIICMPKGLIVSIEE